MWAVNLYFWVAAIGFPVIGMRWIVYEREQSGKDYRTGFDDGFCEADEMNEDKINALFEKIKHGDQDHQNWLRRAIDEHFGFIIE